MPARTDDVTGLTSREAQARLAAHGPNRLVARDRAAWLKEAVRLLLDPMAIMLLAAAGAYLLLGERRDALIMLGALVPVIGVDVFLEGRSRAALKALARGVEPHARVIRDRQEVAIHTSELVPGDLLLLAEGDFVHADGVVRAAANLTLDESSLTGEAEPQAKRPVDSSDGAGAEIPSECRFFAGSTILAGHGRGEIVTTGSATRYGEIARLVAQATSTVTPLQRRVGALVKKLALAAAVVAVALVALGRLRGLGWGQALLGGVSLAMSAAPEEFPLVFTMFLSVGAWRLSRRGVLVRRLASVETLGSTTVICTDKTGTLTRGQFLLDQVIPCPGSTERDLLEAAVLACEPRPSDAMEKAIVSTAAERGVATGELASRWRLVRDHDFDPVGKHMTHVWERVSDGASGETRVVSKGAFEGVIEHVRAGAEERAALEAAHGALAGAGSRVLAVAQRTTAPIVAPPAAARADDERDLVMVGFLGFRDPLRPEVPEAVRQCQTAGVRIKIVTGDHALTAHAVAEAAGIVHRDDAIVTGGQLDAAPETERQRLIADAAILARISPAQKHLIVDTLRAAGEIVAMTGDGINDAPALRRADIGVSMGRRGTEVARAAADLVLMDDDFSSIVAAVAAGRQVFLDIQRAFLFLIAFHIPVIGLALLAPALGLPLLLLPLHLVWLELIVHPVSALLFQSERPPHDLMQRPPRDPRAPMLPRAAVLRSALAGVLLTAAALALYALQVKDGVAQARGVAIGTLILGDQLLALVERAEPGVGWRGLVPRSLRFWLIWFASAASLPLALYVPALAKLLDLAPPAAHQWPLVVGAAVAAVGWRFIAAARR